MNTISLYDQLDKAKAEMERAATNYANTRKAFHAAADDYRLAQRILAGVEAAIEEDNRHAYAFNVAMYAAPALPEGENW